MNRISISAVCFSLALVTQASWYWPFGSSESESEEKDPPRLSELMEPASLAIDNASDYAADGKVSEAVAEYRKALAELDRIEAENYERAQTPEFASLRNKRAYVSAAIDSLLLEEAQSNAKDVSLSDTTELETKLRKEMAEKRREKIAPPEPENEANVGTDELPVEKSEAKLEKPKRVRAKAKAKTVKPKSKSKVKKVGSSKKPLSKVESIMSMIETGRYDEADAEIAKMLSAQPHGALALNLKAMNEMKKGDYKAAESALDSAIESNPRDHYAYYNMALMIVESKPDLKSRAKRYYETGRAIGGPKDEDLEAKLK